MLEWLIVILTAALVLIGIAGLAVNLITLHWTKPR